MLISENVKTAIESKSICKVATLLPVDFETKDKELILCFAAEHGTLPIILYLKETLNLPYFHTSPYHHTPLIYGIEGGDLNVVSYLANIELKKKESTCTTALLAIRIACKCGSIDIVKHLNQTYKIPITKEALISALDECHFKVVDYFYYSDQITFPLEPIMLLVTKASSVRYLHEELDVPLTSGLLNHAVACGLDNIAEYVKQKCPHYEVPQKPMYCDLSDGKYTIDEEQGELSDFLFEPIPMTTVLQNIKNIMESKQDTLCLEDRTNSMKYQFYRAIKKGDLNKVKSLPRKMITKKMIKKAQKKGHVAIVDYLSTFIDRSDE